MKIQTFKSLTWLGALSLGGLLGWDVWQFLEHKPEYEKYVSNEEITEALVTNVQEAEPVESNPSVKVADLTKAFFKLNWTGRREVAQPPPGPATEVQKPPVVAVSSLLTIQSICYSPDQAEAFAFVEFRDGALRTLMEAPKDRLLEVGERLKGKHAHVRVEAIEPDGVRFAFDDAEREPELVRFQPFEAAEAAIVVVGEEGVRLPKRQVAFPQASPQGSGGIRRPRETLEVRRNEYRIGTETLATLDRDYSRILTEDLRYKNAKDPATGRIKGIQVTHVASGSLPAQHGIQQGEILISINGHAVRSVSDAVAYVKKEANTQDTWVALFEKDGRQFTRTYQSPEE